jgi:hypothetical protein
MPLRRGPGSDPVKLFPAETIVYAEKAAIPV